MPVLQWLHTVSFFHAAFEALAVNELRYLQLKEIKVSGENDTLFYFGPVWFRFFDFYFYSWLWVSTLGSLFFYLNVLFQRGAELLQQYRPLRNLRMTSVWVAFFFTVKPDFDNLRLSLGSVYHSFLLSSLLSILRGSVRVR